MIASERRIYQFSERSRPIAVINPAAQTGYNNNHKMLARYFPDHEVLHDLGWESIWRSKELYIAHQLRGGFSAAERILLMSKNSVAVIVASAKLINQYGHEISSRSYEGEMLFIRAGIKTLSRDEFLSTLNPC